MDPRYDDTAWPETRPLKVMTTRDYQNLRDAPIISEFMMWLSDPSTKVFTKDGVKRCVCCLGEWPATTFTEYEKLKKARPTRAPVKVVRKS